ncbi:hypothetical protein BBM1094_08455 [Bifidobacterium breve MCC 1094]|nr:hypothetical protein BBM1094_08455 [Bifidobacterium breve MCC 1094]
MRNCFLFTLLPCSKHGLATALRKKHAAIFTNLELGRFYYPCVDKREYETICNSRTKFFYQIQGQRSSTRSISMQKPHVGIEPDSL